MKKQMLAVTGMILASTLVSVSAMDMMMATDVMMTTNSSAMTSTSIMSSLMMGSHGNDVMTLQTFLEGKGFLNMPTGVAKGYFGMLTKKALMEYQSSEGISSTGYFGAMTRAKVNAHMMAKDSMMPKDSMMKKDSMMMKSDTMMANDGVMVGGALMIRTRDIVDNAVLAKNVTTVVAAVKAAGLVDTLKSAGPFTVFAPNNAAFDALPSGTVATLLLPENKAKLTDILTYHVVSGKYTLADLTDGMTLTTVEGKTLKITKVNGQVMINGSAMIETPNVISSNGVTHVITSVLLPQ
jgi:uncharacterized surface protein with fasciclin (FAS1) repeats